MRCCKDCGYDLPLSDYERRPSRKSGKRNRCRRCRHLRRFYGINRADFDALCESQLGRCAICGCPRESALRGTLFVDHDHETGRVRGLLCYSCNTAIGALGDSAEGVRRALRYLGG